MISKTYINNNLRGLDASFRATTNNKHLYYFSKLSILELCGWIEMSMDDIVMRHCNRKVRLPINHKFIEKDVVGRTYGFDYDKHFRSMLIRLVGVITTEDIERNIDVTVKTLFTAELTSLKSIRNSLAHTYAKSFPSIDAPSRTQARFGPLYDGLIAYDRALRNL